MRFVLLVSLFFLPCVNIAAAEKTTFENVSAHSLKSDNSEENYPVEYKIIEDLTYFGEELLQYSKDLAVRIKDTKNQDKLKTIHRDILLLERDVRGIVALLELEKEHGEKQISLKALAIISSYVESVFGKTKMMLEFYDYIDNKESAVELSKAIRQCISYHTKAREFLDTISKQLTQLR